MQSEQGRRPGLAARRRFTLATVGVAVGAAVALVVNQAATRPRNLPAAEPSPSVVATDELPSPRPADHGASPSKSAADSAAPPLPSAGVGFSGPLPALTDHEAALAKSLKQDVEKLAGEIGDRSMPNYPKLVEAAAFVEKSFQAAGYTVGRQTYEVKGRDAVNLDAERHGGNTADEIVLVGAHYDSIAGKPAADDNASGVAGMLALARALAGKHPDRTVRFVAFTNEEPPYFQEDEMGSLHYAKRCKERHEKIVAMLSLETIGYYSDAPDTQTYPPLLRFLYPTTGDFIAFISDRSSERLTRQVTASFRKHARFPSQWGAMPEQLPGVGWSDHWSFWQQGYPGVMVTDTALYRNPHYHKATDTPEKLDYPRMARVVAGLEQVVGDLATVTDAPAKTSLAPGQ